MPRGDDYDIQLRERLVRLETQIAGLASASTILNNTATAEINAVRTLIQQEVRSIRDGHGEHAEKIAKLETVAERWELFEAKLEKVREDVTGSHRLVLDPRRKSEPPKAPVPAHVDAGWAAAAKVWGPIVVSLISLIGTLVAFILHQQH